MFDFRRMSLPGPQTSAAAYLSLTPGAVRCESLPLQRGWNQFVVKAVQGDGEWRFGASLRSSDPLFLPQLRTSIVGPAGAAPNGENVP